MSKRQVMASAAAATLAGLLIAMPANPVSARGINNNTAIQASIATTAKATGALTGHTTATKPSLATMTVAAASVTAPDTVSYSPSPVVGGTVTADTGSWGPAPVNLLIEWLRDDVVVATGATYRPTIDDYSHQLTMRVTGSKTGYTSVQRASTSQLVAEGVLPITGVPTISGAPAVGSTLVVTPASSDPAANLSYSWWRNGVAISGATSPTYTLTAADLDKTIAARVGYDALGYQVTSRVSANTSAVVAGELTTAEPTISGSATIGSTLTASAPGWGPSPVALSYQWFADGNPIAGATYSQLVVPSLAGGGPITVQVTGTRVGYNSASRVSEPTTPVPQAIFNDPPRPVIVGKSTIGSTLSLQLGTWGPEPVQRYSYQWRRDGRWIDGATSSTYTLKLADAKSSITAVVTGYRQGYAEVTVPSSNAIDVASIGAVFVPITPCRVADTRLTATGLVPANGQFDLQVSGSGDFASQGGASTGCGVPGEATAVAATLSAAAPQGSGWAKIWPAGQPLPNATFLNYSLSRSIGNSGAIPLSGSGAVSVGNFNGRSHYVLDVQGYYLDEGKVPAGATGAVYVPTSPCRVVDTRVSGGPFTGGVVRDYRVSGIDLSAQGGNTAGCAIPDGAQAVSATVTAVNPRGTGYTRVWAAGSAEPNATFLNYSGASIGNTGSVPLATGAGVQITVKNVAAVTDYVIDVQGYFMPAAQLPSGVTGSLFVPLTPCRIADTRVSRGPLAADEARSFLVSGNSFFNLQGGSASGCAVPVSATAVEATVTSLSPSNFGWTRVWPDGATQPTATFLNYPAKQAVGNSGAITLGQGGKVSLQNYNSTTGYVIDVQGVYLPAN